MTTTIYLTSHQLLAAQFLIYIGSIAVAGFILYAIAWVIDKLIEKKRFTQEQIEDIISIVKAKTLQEIEQGELSEEELDARIEASLKRLNEICNKTK